MNRKCGNCRYWKKGVKVKDVKYGRCKRFISAYHISFEENTCSEHEYKQENKMKIEQYISKGQNDPEKKYPKWTTKIEDNGFLIFLFVSESGTTIIKNISIPECKKILEKEGYETDFAEWYSDGSFMRFKEGWY